MDHSNGHTADPTRRFMSLYAANQRRIYGFVRALLHDPLETDDVVQQALGVMWDRFHTFDPNGSPDDFGRWAMAVARIEVMRLTRGRRNHLSVFGSELVHQLADVVARQAGEEDRRLDALRACLDKLTSRQRELIHLRYTEDMSVAKVSEKVGRPSPTVYRMLSQVRRMLLGCIRQTMQEQA
jgi:RNA polymerase sigma-70 factor (ECF subfamily)